MFAFKLTNFILKIIFSTVLTMRYIARDMGLICTQLQFQMETIICPHGLLPSTIHMEKLRFCG